MRRRLAWLGALAASLVACARPAPEAAVSSLSDLDGARFAWVDAACADGSLPLAQLGFERELFTRVEGNRLRMTFDTALVRDGCDALLVWDALHDPEAARWDFLAPAHVALPPDGPCGVVERGTAGGQILRAGDGLEVVTFQSPWCRGFDARFRYRRVAPRELDERDLIRRYIAHYNRRDLRSLLGLFSSSAALLEPFSRTADGSIMRHEGRTAIMGWYERAFASSTWSALRLLDVYAVADEERQGTWVAAWEYMDSELSEPISGRNLFVLADGQVFLTEYQLLSVPEPLEAVADANGPAQASAVRPR